MAAQSPAIAQHNVGSHGGLVRRALIADALFSAVAGAVLVAASGPLSDFTGLEPGWVPAAIGLAVLTWAADVFLIARAEVIRPARVWLVIGGNVAWVLASYGIILAGAPDLTAAGSWTVAILAEIVGLLAVVQYIGLRRMRSEMS